MIIKETDQPCSLLNLFDLLGNDEEALSKSFAYLISSEIKVMFSFMQLIGLKNNISENLFTNTSVKTEDKVLNGRVDINVISIPNFQIIVESKIRSNRLQKQKTQYLPSFKSGTKVKILCFITHLREQLLPVDTSIKIVYLTWNDILVLLEQKKLASLPRVKDFLKFYKRNHRMVYQKEILIQNVSIPTEIKRFKEFRIYRRPETLVNPFYFAPYFTKNAKVEEGLGISYLSRILGILTVRSSEIDLYKSDLFRFSSDAETVNQWINGVKLGNDRELYTYYFLDEPLRLNKNLLKDGGREKGRGKDWIAAMIPPNHCVTFKEFVNRINS